MTFAITNHCNVNCTTCSFPQLPPKKKKHISLKDAQFAIDFFEKNGVRMISITGGEPLLHPDFISICDYISKKNMMISYISTSGALITDTIASKLSKMNVNIVGISIDIMDEKGIGITRKMNIKKTATNAKKLLDKYKIETYAGFLLSQPTRNIHEVTNTARSLGFKKIIFSYPQTNMDSSYLAFQNSDDLKGDVKFWENIVVDILKEKRNNINVDIFNTRVNLNELLSFYKGNGYTFECPAGRSQFYLDWDLVLYRCLNSDEKYGNLRDIKNLNFKYKSCSACSQQAHRDYASFYHAFEVVKSLEVALKDLNGKELINILKDKRNRKSMNSLIEGYLGGFV